MGKPLVVVTGAAGALGRVVARHFLERGHPALLVDLDRGALEKAYADAPGDHRYVAVDLTATDRAVAAIGAALAEDGPAGILCNIAGGFAMGHPVHDPDGGDWQKMLDMNVATLLNACRAVVPGMVEAGRGKIVNVAAASASSGKASMGPYVASKSAVARLTESMALELRGHGINVNAVAPSIIDTPANRAAMPKADPADWVSPQQLADVIGFLSSDAASAIHGAVIPVVGLS
jgi:NAD(P)-dependent dehydrogenase (short-subunit alcohol dehydrogenase family)